VRTVSYETRGARGTLRLK